MLKRYNSGMLKCLPIFSLFLLVSCGTGNPEPVKKDPEQKQSKRVLEGVWTGKVAESDGQLNQGKESSFLSERLGGFTLKLQGDGKFLADWRGLTRDGSWQQKNNSIELTTEHVFGKDKGQAESENQKAGKPLNDLSLFDQKISLTLDSKDWKLNLPALKAGEVAVVFSREAD